MSPRQHMTPEARESKLPGWARTLVRSLRNEVSRLEDRLKLWEGVKNGSGVATVHLPGDYMPDNITPSKIVLPDDTRFCFNRKSDSVYMIMRRDGIVSVLATTPLNIRPAAANHIILLPERP